MFELQAKETDFNQLRGKKISQGIFCYEDIEVSQQSQEKVHGQLGIGRHGTENWEVIPSREALPFSHASYSLGLFHPLYQLSVGQNHLEDLLKCRLLGSSPERPYQ